MADTYTEVSLFFFLAVMASLWIWETLIYLVGILSPVWISRTRLAHPFLVAAIGYGLTRNVYQAMAIAGLLFVGHTALDRMSTEVVSTRRRRL